MKNWLNIDSTTLPTAGVLAVFAIIIIIGSLAYWKSEMKGLVMYLGIIVTIIGLMIIYISIIDKTL